jgi:hypothetical protein
MARSVEQTLAALRVLDPADPKAAPMLRAALEATRPRAGLVVAAAARFIAEHRLEPLLPALVEAYEDLLVDPVKRDPGCRGKIAIARALHALDHWEARVFARGVQVLQPEGSHPQEDTAAELRAVCGLAHAE